MASVSGPPSNTAVEIDEKEGMDVILKTLFMASCTGPLCLYSFFLLDGGPSGAASSQSWIPIKRSGRPLKEGPFFRIEATLGYRSPLGSTSFSLYAFPSYFLFPYFWSSISDRIHQRHLGVMARPGDPLLLTIASLSRDFTPWLLLYIACISGWEAQRKDVLDG